MPGERNIVEINAELADRINAEARADPNSPYTGKFVGIANGKVVVVSADADEVDRVLDEFEPDPSKTFVVEASRDYGQVEYI